MAEAILVHHLEARGISDLHTVDSAGTGAWHVGESADPRTIATLRRHGIACRSIARQLRTSDFEQFDVLLAMDRNNLRDMLEWPGCRADRCRMFLPYDVPDPYYGGPDGFERMFDMINIGCTELLKTMTRR